MANFDDTFDESRDFVEVLYQNGKDVKASELVESQRIERVRRRRAFDSIKPDSFNGDGFKVEENTGDTSNKILVKAGNGFVNGEIVTLENDFVIDTLTTPGAPRVDKVYLEVREIERTSVDFPDIGDSSIGETATRNQLVTEIFVAEGASVPASTGDLHQGGIQRIPLATLNRDANADVLDAEIVDDRNLIGLGVAIGGTGRSSFDDGAVLLGGGGINDLEQTNPVEQNHVLMDEGPLQNPVFRSFNKASTVTNYRIDASISSGDLTISLKTESGADPSASDPVIINNLRNALETSSGSYSKLRIESPLSVTFDGTSSLGINAGDTFESIFVYLFMDSGTPNLAVSNNPTLGDGRIRSVIELDASSDTRLAGYGNFVGAPQNTTYQLLGGVQLDRLGGGDWDNISDIFMSSNVALNHPVASEAILEALKEPSAANNVLETADGTHNMTASAANRVANQMDSSGADSIASKMSSSHNMSTAAANRVIENSDVGSLTETGTILGGTFFDGEETKFSLTAPATGRYLCYSVIEVDQSSVGGSPEVDGGVDLRLKVEGSTLRTRTTRMNIEVTSGNIGGYFYESTVSIIDTLDLTSGDEVTITAEETRDNIVSGIGIGHLAIVRIY